MRRRIKKDIIFIVKGIAVSILILSLVFTVKLSTATDVSTVEAKDTSKLITEEKVIEPVVVEPVEIIAPEEDPYWELYEEGFTYYQIPEKYINLGGYLPEDVQAYLWELCKERELDYYMVLALIERESGYRSDAVGDSGNSFGYCQVYKKWHIERMAKEQVEDLTDPYGNLKVGTSFLAEIQEKYKSSGAHCILMVYNMGEDTAKKLWKDYIYSSEYSRGIMRRAEEIEQELKDLNGGKGV